MSGGDQTSIQKVCDALKNKLQGLIISIILIAETILIYDGHIAAICLLLFAFVAIAIFAVIDARSIALNSKEFIIYVFCYALISIIPWLLINVLR